ncbi:MAG: hypothetical protein ACQEWV_24745 [Bacillota bacterium]
MVRSIGPYYERTELCKPDMNTAYAYYLLLNEYVQVLGLLVPELWH